MLFKFHFFADEKHVTGLLVALNEKAIELECVPVVNAVRKGKEVHAKTGGSGYELLMDYMTKTNMTEITGTQARHIMSEIGLVPDSYSYHIQQAIRHKLLKRAGKAPSGNGLRYARVMLREVK